MGKTQDGTPIPLRQAGPGPCNAGPGINPAPPPPLTLTLCLAAEALTVVPRRASCTSKGAICRQRRRWSVLSPGSSQNQGRKLAGDGRLVLAGGGAVWWWCLLLVCLLVSCGVGGGSFSASVSSLASSTSPDAPFCPLTMRYLQYPSESACDPSVRQGAHARGCSQKQGRASPKRDLKGRLAHLWAVPRGRRCSENGD